MVVSILLLVVSLLMILAGASALTDGASSIARRWGMSDLVIGLTVVAFGTSAPELAISITSAVNGNPAFAIGNVVGSNIFNVFVIIGVTAMLRPIVITRTIMTKDIPLVFLSALALLAIGNGPWLDGDVSAMVSRVDGILLLLFFAIFLRHTFSQAKAEESSQAEAEDTRAIKRLPLWRAIVYVALGLGALVYFGDLFVESASAIARGMGASEAIVGLTIVAAGTSLPELATSVTAALKGKPGIALGNVIGSNIFNIFMVLGASATIRPLPFGSIGNFDLCTLAVACLLFWVFGWFFKKRTITRVEGAILAACYLGYVGVLIAGV